MIPYYLILFIFIIGILKIIKSTFYVNVKYNDLTNKNEKNITFVQLSDLHGRTRFLNGSISKFVNKINPDIVFITGDITSKERHLLPVIKEINKITCDNKIFVPGNYERQTIVGFSKRNKTKEEYKDFVDELTLHDIKYLENDGIMLKLGDKKIYIYGIDNSIYGNESFEHFERDNQNFTVLLAHSPNIIPILKDRQIHYNLLLTGHTHGGQIRFFNKTLGAYKHFHLGMKFIDQSKCVYINPGLGTVKIPIRFSCPPEISVFTM